MKKLPSKSDVRKEIDHQVDDFLQQGGEVTEVPTGQSRYEAGAPSTRSLFDKPRDSRTFVPEVVAAIESRKQQRSKSPRAVAAKPRPRKRIIYDDFGEVVREIWVDDGQA